MILEKIMQLFSFYLFINVYIIETIMYDQFFLIFHTVKISFGWKLI